MRHYKFCFLIPLICSILSISHIYASVIQQSIPVSGEITDTEGIPLPGVNIIVEGTTIGTVTNGNGLFSITVPGENSVLVVSFLGYEQQKMVVGENRNFRITLLESASEIDEVVIVAYGSQKKVSVTGAISTVQTKELKQSASANFSSALAGRLPGLTMMQTRGKPGDDDFTMYLRGRGTLNDASPLILIDGVPRDDISWLDANEIASVSILKDASATAVFGVRGANGVILITTRRGEAGKSELSISVDRSWQQFTTRPDRIHSWEHAEMRNQAARNDGSSEASLPFTPYMIDMYKSGKDPVFYPDRDIYHEYYNDWAPQTRVSASLNGGTEKVKYFMNMGYLGQGGLVKTASKNDLGFDPSMKLDRYSFRVNMDYQVEKNLKLSLNMSANMDKINSPNTWKDGMTTENMLGFLFMYAWQTPPASPGPLSVNGYGISEGAPVNSEGLPDSAWRIINQGYHEETRSGFNSSIALDWGLDFITKGLNTKVILSYDMFGLAAIEGLRAINLCRASVPRNEGSDPFYFFTSEEQVESLSLSKRYGGYYYMNLQYMLNYARRFGLHDVTGMAMFQRDSWQNKNWASNNDLPYNLLGVVGRVTYGYDNRYLAEINMGYNGSEQFAPKNRFGFFPAFSVGWVVSNEKFLKDNEMLNYLKLRASYGKVGNDKIGGNRFLYISTKERHSGGEIASLGRGNWIYHGRQGNETLQWEVAAKQNYGIDVRLFRDFSLNVDIYAEKRDKILITRQTIPEIQGIDLNLLPKANMGEVHNKGYELDFAWQKQINNDLSLLLKAQYAYNENKVIFTDEPLLSEDYQYRYRNTGYSIGQPFGYLIDYSNGNGYINTQEELDNLLPYNVGGNPRLGDFIYVNVNGDDVIDEKDQAPIGYSQVPRISYGFSGAVNYRNFDFSFLFSGIARSNLYYDSFLVAEHGYVGVYNDMHKQAWTKERYESGQTIDYPALGISRGSSLKPNSFYLFDRSFLRLKNLEFGYTLPVSLTQKIGVSRLRAYMNGNNLWVWKKYPFNGIDPEQIRSDTYPITRMMNVGINVNF